VLPLSIVGITILFVGVGINLYVNNQLNYLANDIQGKYS